MKDGPVLFYSRDGVLYPVGMTASERMLFEMAVRVIEPLKVVFDQPQGTLLDLSEKKEDA